MKASPLARAMYALVLLISAGLITSIGIVLMTSFASMGLLGIIILEILAGIAAFIIGKSVARWFSSKYGSDIGGKIWLIFLIIFIYSLLQFIGAVSNAVQASSSSDTVVLGNAGAMLTENLMLLVTLVCVFWGSRKVKNL